MQHIKEHDVLQKHNAYFYALLGTLFTGLFITVTFLLIKYVNIKPQGNKTPSNRIKVKLSPKLKTEAPESNVNLELTGVTMNAEV